MSMIALMMSFICYILSAIHSHGYSSFLLRTFHSSYFINPSVITIIIHKIIPPSTMQINSFSFSFSMPSSFCRCFCFYFCFYFCSLLVCGCPYHDPFYHFLLWSLCYLCTRPLDWILFPYVLNINSKIRLEQSLAKWPYSPQLKHPFGRSSRGLRSSPRLPLPPLSLLNPPRSLSRLLCPLAYSTLSSFPMNCFPFILD